MKRCLKQKKFVLDTSVLIEYIIEREPYRRKVEEIFNKSIQGEIQLYIPITTLSEVIYVASRVYEAANIPNPNEEAINYIEWIETKTTLIEITEEIALRAGELKKKLRIALPDCYVIAAAESINAIPLFKRKEREMIPIEENLRKLGVKFLNEI